MSQHSSSLKSVRMISNWMKRNWRQNEVWQLSSFCGAARRRAASCGIAGIWMEHSYFRNNFCGVARCRATSRKNWSMKGALRWTHNITWLLWWALWVVENRWYWSRVFQCHAIEYHVIPTLIFLQKHYICIIIQLYALVITKGNKTTTILINCSNVKIKRFLIFKNVVMQFYYLFLSKS